MKLGELQTTVERWIRTHDDYWDQFQILARLTEELGEVAAALQRRECLRPGKVEVDLEGEVGDFLLAWQDQPVGATSTNIYGHLWRNRVHLPLVEQH